MPALSAAVLVIQHLADCLPPEIPPVYREIVAARFRGTGRRRVAVAELVMFDGQAATVEVFRWGHNAWGHRWVDTGQAFAFFEDGRWQRDRPEARQRLLFDESGVAA